MIRTRRRAGRMTALSAVLLCGMAMGQDYEIDWHTIDEGGGGVPGYSTGGGFDLGVTIGQTEAGIIAGGSFVLVGGFWAMPPCWCMSDMNQDGLRDGLDVQGFVDCLLNDSTDCACADLSADGVLDIDDVIAFVRDLLAAGDGPLAVVGRRHAHTP